MPIQSQVPQFTGNTIETDVLVIGAGLAGLSCSIGLIDSGLRIIVIEKEGLLGGRARSWIDTVTGDPIDIGPHIFISEYPNTLALLRMLGTSDRIVWQTDEFISLVDGTERVVMRMGPLPPPFHFLPSVFSDRTVRFVDKLSNLRASARATQMDEQDTLLLDGIDAYGYLRSLGVSEAYIRRFWAFVSLAIMNVPIEECSAGALFRFYRHLIGHNDYRIGFPNCGLGAMFAEQSRSLLERSGVQVLINTEVGTILGDEHRVTGARLRDGTKIVARYCVAALPPQEFLNIARHEWLEKHQAFRDLSSLRPCPYISVYTWWDKKLTRHKFWARMPSADHLNLDFYDLSNINDGWTMRPSLIASNIVYSHRARSLSDGEIVAGTIRELSEFLPGARHASVLHSVVNRIPMAIFCPYPGTESKRLPTEGPIAGLFLAGDWTRTGVPSSMESAVRSGWIAAEAVLSAVGRHRKLAIELKETEGPAGLIRQISTRVRGRLGVVFSGPNEKLTLPEPL